MLVPITNEERLLPEYKFYIRPMTAPPEGRYELAESAILEEDSDLLPSEINKLFEPGYLKNEFGICPFSDGTLTVANFLPMPGVSAEMMAWWFNWHGLKPIRYKMWDPEEHLDIKTSDPERRMNQSIPLKERIWNTIDWVVEDNLGTGRDNPNRVTLSFRDPRDIGFSPEKLQTFGGTIICMGDEKAPIVAVHFVRPVEEGCELRSRFYVGYSVFDNKIVRVTKPGQEAPLKRGKLMIRHNIKEFTNLAAILPDVYNEFKDTF